MKKLTLLVAIVIFCLPRYGYSQKYPLSELEKSKEKIRHISDTMVQYISNLKVQTNLAISKNKLQSNRNVFISPRSFDILFSKQISMINTGKEHIYEGSALTLKNSSDATKANLNFTFRLSDVTYFGLGVEAGISEGIATLFKDGEGVPGVTYIGSLSFTPKKARKLFANKQDNESVNRLSQIRTDYYNLNEKYYNTYYTTNYLRILKEYQSFDSLKLDDDTYVKGYDGQVKLISDIDGYDIRMKEKEVRHKLKSKIDHDLYEIEVNDEAVEAMKISWFSGNLKYSKLKYQTFNDNYYFYEKLGSRIFEKWEFSLAFNQVYKKSESDAKPLNRYFINAGLNFRKRNEYEDADKRDYQLEVLKGNSQDSTIVYEKKNNLIDVTNTGFISTWECEPYFFFVTPLTKREVVSASVGASAKFRESSLPVYEPKFGLVFNVIEEEKSTSKINFELFVKVEDVFNVYKEKNIANNRGTFSKRAVFGINTVVPFSKIFLN